MRARIVRIAVSFAAVFSAYLVYALVAVRLIEPSISVVPKTPRSQEKYEAARNVGSTASMQLRKYFPEGSWELKNPKVVGNDRVKLLVSEYTNRPGGIMELKKCTLLFFEEQTPNGPSDAPPIILQAPEGADLKFDEDFDLKRAKIGQPVGGRLKGKVTISRQPSRPGAHDDLKIVTRDVQLIEDRVVTPHVVEFWYGASHGTGRDLTILLERKDTTGKPGKTPSIQGVKWLTLTRDVVVQLAVASPDRAAPAPPNGPAGANPFAPNGQGGAQPPVKITCQGPLRFDMEHQVCTFSEKVDVFRLNPSGPSDEMNCELLAVHFAEREKPGETPAARNARQAAKGPQSLEARWIEALGDPVIIRAPSQGSQIRSQRVEYDLKSGRIVLDGPGKLQGASQGNTAGRYSMRWAHQMRVDPLVGEQLVTLLGGAEVTMTGMGSRSADGAPQSGTLWADEIRAWLTSPPGNAGPAGAAGPRKGGAPPMVIRPAPAPPTDGSLALERARLKRVLAQGAVRIESPQLVGATGQLDAIFVPAPPAAPGAPGQPGQSGQPGQNGQGRRSTPSQQQFRVGGAKMEIHFTVRGAQTAVSELVLVGKAQLAEARTASPEDKPWLVTGERLEVVRADAPDTRIVVIGNPRAPDGRNGAAAVQSSPSDRFAHVEARGLTLDGQEIQLQRDRNLLSIDGPGRLIGPAPADQDLFGQAMPGAPKARPAEAGNVEITWTGWMKFDGLKAHFERDVVARSATMLIHSDTLEASLLRAVDFSKPPTPGAQGEPATLEQLVCSGGPRGLVELENRSTDETGLSSIDRMEALDLSINRTTGAINARGPGLVTSVRRGAAAAMSQRSGGAAARPDAQKPPAADSQTDPNALTFLAVKFAREISGDMHKREMTFANQVKTIYGPVPAWEATLDVENPDRAGPDSMALTCEALTVREAPGRPADGRSSMELEAQRNVQAEGMGFVARSHRLTFSEQKSLMVMEGDGMSDALVFRQEKVGGPRSNYNAGRILFWPSTRRIEVGNAHFIDLGATQANPGRRDKTSATK